MDDSPVLVAGRTGLRRIVRDWVIRHCDGVMVPSELAANEYARYCSSAADRTQFAAVPIIYDERHFRKDEDEVFRLAAAWRRANLKPNERAAFFVGRLSPEKNLKWLLGRAADTRWPSDLRLFIVGSGIQEDELVAFAREECTVGRVQFLGRQEGVQLYALMAAQDIFILPSRSEPFGAVVSESLHWGGPCFVSENVGAKALINDANGEVFRLQDAGTDFHHKLLKMAGELPGWKSGRASRMGFKLDECISGLVKAMSIGSLKEMRGEI